MKKLIVFNWKMAPDSLKKAKQLFNLALNSSAKGGKSHILNSEIVVCPPFIYLSELVGLINKTKIKLGAQNVFWENPLVGGGVYTGEISPKMLKNLGVEYAIIGHSERRKYLNETDEIINKKVLAALKAGLKVILCIGEDLSIRKRGKKAVEKFIKNQLGKDLKNLSLNSIRQLADSILNSRLIIAYEPIWSIGTGHSDTPQDALEIIKFIKETLNSQFSILNSKILYGGSVDSKNIVKFLKHPEIDGALIGHASLKTGEIRKIFKELY
ncbi:MAG: triose-phosphate isomerase [Patescibacteria group bacterium]